jgi:type IV pilus assembly protein PilA
MKFTLPTRLLQHLAKKKNQNGGFTLIELLVVIVIIGILAAVALPSMLNQANKSKEAGAKSSVGAANRAQQAYRLEKPNFAATFAELGIGEPQVDPYGFAIGGAETTTVTTTATPTDTTLKTITGTVTIDTTTGTTTSTLSDGTEAEPEVGG